MFPIQKNDFGQKNFFLTSKGPPFYASQNCQIWQSKLMHFPVVLLSLKKSYAHGPMCGLVCDVVLRNGLVTTATLLPSIISLIVQH